jgi:hypothetical protein
MNINEEIKKRIHEKFPSLFVSIFPDETQDNTIVAIDNDLYYSEEYLALIMDIKINVLWKNNLFNYLFVKEKPQVSLEDMLFETGPADIFVPIGFSIGNSLNAIFDSSLYGLTRELPAVSSFKSSGDVIHPHNNIYAGDSLWPMAA